MVFEISTFWIHFVECLIYRLCRPHEANCPVVILKTAFTFEMVDKPVAPPYAWIIFVAYTIAFVIQVRLLLKCLFGHVGEKLSPQIQINMFLWCVQSGLAFLLFGNRCVFYWVDYSGKSLSSLFNWFFGLDFARKVLLYMSLPLSSLAVTISLSVIFVLLDRILIILFPLRYHKYRHLSTKINVLACGFLTLVVLIGQTFEDTYRRKPNDTGKLNIVFLN